MALKPKERRIKVALVILSFAFFACSASLSLDGKNAIPVEKP